ncbi:MAG TPA: response regulator transcription factor [Methylomirabilota bacterium]|jgi:DNA-binding NarL/FixJ family response regulator|nr:response regulator transcription factor [Methylomirabilota bacterium]
MPTTVLLADDHAIVRQGLRALLERDGLQIVGEVSSGREAVRIARERRPDVAVLDFAMPLLNGLDAGREILQATRGTKVILLTMHTDDQYVLEAIRAGVKGYVVKTQAAADLIRAIEDVCRGLIYLSPTISQTVVQAFLTKAEVPVDPLTPREREVLQLVAEGKTSKEIAHFLGVSVKTAEAHRGRLMGKLEVHGTAGLVRHAIRRGLIQP